MQHATRRFPIKALALIVCGISASFAMALPPAAPSLPVTEMMHGVNVADPYRNLENVKNADTQAWLKAQGDYAAEQLGRIEDRDVIAARIEALAKAAGDSVRGVMRCRASEFII